MKIDERFFLERKEINKGRQAVVYFWEGFAYKVFPETYPHEAIWREMQIQQEIARASLPIPKYYATDHPNIIAMEYIDGIPLSERMLNQGYASGLQDLLDLQRMVHRVDFLDLPYIDDWLRVELEGSDFPESIKIQALTFVELLGRANNLCHLDFHPLNILWSGSSYKIVDWVNARLGKPVYDLARTYVIFHEVAAPLADQYLSFLQESGENIDDFNKAVYVMALWRAKKMGKETFSPPNHSS